MRFPEGLMNSKHHPWLCLHQNPQFWLGHIPGWVFFICGMTSERAGAVIKRLAAAASSSRYHSNSRNISELSCSPWGSGEQLFHVCKSALKGGKRGRERWGMLGTGMGFQAALKVKSPLRSSSAQVPLQDAAGKYPRSSREAAGPQGCFRWEKEEFLMIQAARAVPGHSELLFILVLGTLDTVPNPQSCLCIPGRIPETSVPSRKKILKTPKNPHRGQSWVCGHHCHPQDETGLGQGHWKEEGE